MKTKHCGDCALFGEEDINGDGWCEFHQEPRECGDDECNYSLPKDDSDEI